MKFTWTSISIGKVPFRQIPVYFHAGTDYRKFENWAASARLYTPWFHYCKLLGLVTEQYSRGLTLESWDQEHDIFDGEKTYKR